MTFRSVSNTLHCCNIVLDLWTATKTLFPSEYQERHKLERKKRRHRASLPGTNGGRGRPGRRGNNGAQNSLTTCAGVCFVLLFMMGGFTIFATTVGFCAWYLLETAMALLVDLTLEIQTFTEVLKTCLILCCVDGGLSREKWRSLYDSAARVAGAFTRLVRSRNSTSHIQSAAVDTLLLSEPQTSAQTDYSYHALWKGTQHYIANYVVFGCLVTFVLYKFAKYIQARRA